MFNFYLVFVKGKTYYDREDEFELPEIIARAELPFEFLCDSSTFGKELVVEKWKVWKAISMAIFCCLPILEL